MYVGYPGGPERMLTANHCGLGKDWRTPQNDLLVGTLGSPSLCFKDTASLSTTGTDPYMGYVYTGPWDSTQAVDVVGSEFPFVGQNVCVSDSWSGEHVVRVESVGNYIASICAPWATGPGFYTVDDQQDGSAGDGDSGGPVYVASGSGVSAVGMINAGDVNNAQPCEGRAASWRKCSSRVFHIDIKSVLSDIDDLSCRVTKLYLQ